MPEIRHEPIPTGLRIGLYESDTCLASLWLFDLRLRVGHRAVRMGGIGGVGTHREHRGKGYARQVMDDALALMRAEGYALSVLFGIPGFYPKWGFTPALVEATLQIDTAAALAAPGKLPVRAMKADDTRAVVTLYERANVDRTGSIVRQAEEFAGFRYGVDWNDNVDALVVEHAGQVVGYAAYNSEPWAGQVAEVACDGVAAMSSLMRFIGERAHERHREKVIIKLPPDHPLVGYCAGLGCQLMVEYPRWGNGMARIIDQGALLREIAPLLALRLQAAAALSWRGVIVVETSLGSDRIALGEGKEQVVQLAQERLTQLVLGYRSAGGLFAEDEISCAPELVPVLEAIFPRGCPYMWHPDRF
jgi:predicted acetyltransferase